MPRKIALPVAPARVAPAFPEWIDAFALASGVAESYTVPSSIKYIRIKADGILYARIGGTAAAPTDITDGTGSVVITPEGDIFGVSPGQVISLIASATRLVSISCYTS